jgi:hypothetical protein
LKAYTSKTSLNAWAIDYHVINVLKIQLSIKFNADGVDANMLQRLHTSIDSGKIQINSMNVKGDGGGPGGEGPARTYGRHALGRVLALCVSRVQGPTWQQAFCGALQRFSIFSISPT